MKLAQGIDQSTLVMRASQSVVGQGEAEAGGVIWVGQRDDGGRWAGGVDQVPIPPRTEALARRAVWRAPWSNDR